MRPPREPSVVAQCAAIVSGHLAAAVDGAKRLSDPSDVEALHDFRVGLRRLRVALRGYGDVLKLSSDKELRKSLRTLARRSGRARDAEVLAAWLAANVERLPAEVRLAAKTIVSDVRAVEISEMAVVREEGPTMIAAIAAQLRTELGLARRRRQAPGDGGFRALSKALGAALLDRLVAGLRKIDGPDDQDRAHRMRIVAKRLRYLAEPIARSPRGAALGTLKRLQDRLGVFHDLGVCASALVDLGPPEYAGVSCDPSRSAAIAAFVTLARLDATEAYRALTQEFLVAPELALAPVRRLCGAGRREKPV